MTRIRLLQSMRESLNISMPPRMRAWIEELMKARGDGNVSEYIRDLVRRDQLALERERVNAELLKAIASMDAGRGVEHTDRWLAERLERLHRSSSGD